MNTEICCQKYPQEPSSWRPFAKYDVLKCYTPQIWDLKVNVILFDKILRKNCIHSDLAAAAVSVGS